MMPHIQQPSLLINDNTTDKKIKLSGSYLPVLFNKYIISANDNCKNYSIINSSDALLLPANSVVTLYVKQ